MMELEPALRLGSFVGVLALLLLAERLAPWAQPRPLGRWRRWLPNFGIVALGAVFLRLTMPVVAVGAAIWAQSRGVGLFPTLGVPFWAALLLTVVLMDLLIYFQHRVFHAVPALWRLHRVHHADPELDASSGLRFHPFEFWLSMWIKVAAVVALGAPPEGVLLFEIILNSASMFEHAAIRVPPRVERAVGWLLVTPNQHRIHHSERREETDSHYGFFLSVWDRLFGTWRGRHEGELVLGVKGWREAEEQTIPRLLLQPFKGPAHGDAPPEAERHPPAGA